MPSEHEFEAPSWHAHLGAESNRRFETDRDEIIELAQSIKAARHRAGMTQRQVAMAMGTDQGTIARLESGRHLPSTRNLQRFARATNVRFRVLFDEIIAHPSDARLEETDPQKGTLFMKNDPGDPIPFLNYLASRRKLLGATAATAASIAIRSPSHAQESTPGATAAPQNGVQADGTWVFTDDRGVTVTLPKQPERVFADLKVAAPLWDFGITPIAVSGWSVSSDVAWGNLDRSIESINESDESGMPDLEKLLSLKPDVYVNVTFDPSDPGSLWGFSDPEEIARYEKAIPIIAISSVGSLQANTERIAELAGLLGADLQSPTVAQAKADYDSAIERFSALAAEKADLKVIFGSIREATWHIANPPDWADLSMFAELGLTIIEPDVEAGIFWQELSKEQALRYPADVVFQTIRAGVLTLEEVQADQVYSQHPAIGAGQIGHWNQDFIMSYRGLTLSLNGIAETLQDAVTVS